MRQYVILFWWSLLISNWLYAQDIRIEREESTSINSFAQSINEVKDFVSAEALPIAVRVIECSVAVSGQEDKDVVLTDLYIRIKQATQSNPSGELGWFWVRGEFLNPRNYKFIGEFSVLSFESGPEGQVQNTRLKVGHQKIEIQ